MDRPSRCRCGHPADTHEHFRRGRDCGACECRRFAAAPLPHPRVAMWRRLLVSPLPR